MFEAYSAVTIHVGGTLSGFISKITGGVTSSPSGAGATVYNDIAGMILHLGDSLNGISTLIAGVTYILGAILITRGLFKLRVMADHRSQMMQPMEIGGPLFSILIGGMLIWSNTLLDTMTMTLWGSGSPLEYTPSFSGDFNQVWSVILKIMKIVGFIAFVRGWFYLTRVGSQNAQPGTVGKGLTHIIGGVLAYHMGATINVLMTTFGFNWS
jgi:intracellular multiplication protein IcmC